MLTPVSAKISRTKRLADRLLEKMNDAVKPDIACADVEGIMKGG